MEKKYVSYNEVEEFCKTISEYVEGSKDLRIVAPSRGGLYLGLRMSHILEKSLSIIDYSLRDYPSEDSKPKIVINKIPDDFEGTILLTDEILDTGVTANAIINMLNETYPKANVVFMVLDVKNEGIEKIKDTKHTLVYNTHLQSEDVWVTYFWEEK